MTKTYISSLWEEQGDEAIRAGMQSYIASKSLLILTGEINSYPPRTGN